MDICKSGACEVTSDVIQLIVPLFVVRYVPVGGPAHQSGLRQGDSVLQLNGLPVETWKCAELAQAIR